MYELIIFDMDGVLIDACEWHRVALNEALKEVCNYEISLEEHYKEFNGIPTKIKLKKLADYGIVAEDKFSIIEEIKQQKTIELINKNSFVRNEKIELMKFLKTNNIKIACYTNSIRKTAELMLEKAGILQYLDLLVTNQDVTAAKPDPEGYFFAMNKLHTAIENTIIIEDSPKGIQAAISTGCNFIQVNNQDEVDLKLIKDYIK